MHDEVHSNITVINFRQTRALSPKAKAAYGATVAMTYQNATVAQMRSLVEQSGECFYDFKYECHHVTMKNHLGIVDYQGNIHGELWHTYGGGSICNEDVNGESSIMKSKYFSPTFLINETL